MFVIGLIGNKINIFIFSIQVNYRRTSWTFYFLIDFINNFVFLLPTSPIRILSAGFRMDFIRSSNNFCKLFLIINNRSIFDSFNNNDILIVNQQWTNGTIDREIVPFSAEMVKSIRL